MMKHKRYLLCVLPAIAVIGLLYFYAQIPPKTQSPHKVAHLSIDDVVDSLNDLTDNQHNYDSVFSQSFFNYLKRLHEKHGAKFSLFVFEKKGPFHIARVPLKYQKEFEQNASWLRFGYHGRDPAQDGNFHSLPQSFFNVQNAVIRFAGRKSLCAVLRLHRYTGDEEFITFLAARDGIKGFLCADDSRASYDLTSAEALTVRHTSRLFKNNVNYYRTDLRVENTFLTDYDLYKIQNQDRIIVFTHEWALNNGFDRYKLERCIQWLSQRAYEFSFLD